MLSYNITIVFQLEEQEYVHSVAFSKLCMENMSFESFGLCGIVLSDEYVFHVPGFANTQEIVFWEQKTEENPTT